MFVGAKHDRIQYGIITNNLYAVMLRPPQKPDAPFYPRHEFRFLYALPAISCVVSRRYGAPRNAKFYSILGGNIGAAVRAAGLSVRAPTAA
jgi:hypothetical protein